MSSAASALLGFAFVGCSTGPDLSLTAPRSSVERADALTLAKHVATSIGGRVYAIAPSGSMIPTLDEGSIVTVEMVNLDKLKKGDIIIYRNCSGMTVIHRLYEQHGDHWFVLGDNNASVDRETVSAENFLGRVCAIFYTASALTAVDNTSVGSTASAVAHRN